MAKYNYHVLGLMSGTSLDGVDLVQVEFFQDREKEWSYKIKNTATVPYPKPWEIELAEALNFSEEELRELDVRYTAYLADVISSFIKQDNIKDIDAICSHGHTIKHEPDKGFTLQIGNRPELAKLTGQRVVCDFRVQDVQLGGQGAPLVPIGDRLLFPEYKYCLNLGGFANISTEGAGGKRIAFDVCPVNTVLNYHAKKLGKNYDEGGKIAASGKLNQNLLTGLNALSFYVQEPPKSLGVEWVNKEIFPLLKNYEDDIPSILRTYCSHIAQQIAKSVDNNPKSGILVTGGGTFNSFLLEKLRESSKCEFIIPPRELIDFKEALVFAFLGVLRLRGEVNVLKSVTGAKSDHSSGVVFEP